MANNALETQPIHLLLVEDEPDLRSTLTYNFKRAGYRVTAKENGREALDFIQSDEGGEARVDVVVSDVMMPAMDGIEFARQLRELKQYNETPLMFLTAKGDTQDRLDGFRVGADDYLTKPFDLEELLARVQVQARRARLAHKVRHLLTEEAVSEGNSSANITETVQTDLYQKVVTWEKRFPALAAIREQSIVGQSQCMLHLLREILIRASGSDPVLIVGQTGTGKTGVAEALHQLGPRAERDFRVVNCAELAAADSAITLGKLFGYGKNSGLANVPKEGQSGLLNDMNGGTLFLDEIHRLPQEAQAMLLLPIEGRPFHPAIGKGPPNQVDVKFIFATNVDLMVEANAGRFPFDLLQRLAQSQIHVPSLNERIDDIPALAEHFLEESNQEFGLDNPTFSPSLLNYLIKRTWSGNVRELRAFVRELIRRAAFELDTVLTLDHLPHQGTDPAVPPKNEDAEPSETTLTPDSHKPTETVASSDGFWNEIEANELLVLRKHRFRLAAAEQELGLSSKSRTLTNHLRGMCFKALAHSEFDVAKAAQLIVSRQDEALIDRCIDRMDGYLYMIEKHVAAHTTKTLFNNLPRDYRKFVEAAIQRYQP